MIWKWNKKIQQLIKNFNYFYIKQCYCIVWRAEKIQKVKSQGLKKQKKMEQ